ncbi:MAG: 50S ribosomal protein L11 methyltransferase [Xanthomonadales bacterium]|nr:50S ribosomal protein L11 methyltransferase [Xanthomonadales bacterium]
MVLRPGVRIECCANAQWQLLVNGRTLDVPEHLFLIIDRFRRPSSIRSALEGLRPFLSGVHEWVQLVREIHWLMKNGVLRTDDDANTPFLDSVGMDFSGAPLHSAMLNDHARTAGYIRAIEEVVCAGDVVVDLGTGTGVLAIAAARAGARRVYAVEGSAIAGVAERMFAANGLADRITLLRGWSTRIELPEPADVLVSEIIGNDPLGEGILEFTSDAVRRWLKPDARLLPSRLRVMAVPVQIDEQARDHWQFTETSVRRWLATYGIDFSSLLAASVLTPMSVQVASSRASAWLRLADSQELVNYDLSARVHARTSVETHFEIHLEGRLDGVLLWFEASLSRTTVLTTDPSVPRDDNHWDHSFRLLANPRHVLSGQRVRFRLGPTSGGWSVEIE